MKDGRMTMTRLWKMWKVKETARRIIGAAVAAQARVLQEETFERKGNKHEKEEQMAEERRSYFIAWLAWLEHFTCGVRSD